MDPPPVKYCKTSDGVSIAYVVFGDGPPLVEIMSPPWSHLGRIWQTRRERERLERWAVSRRLVRYDGRGAGLSERDVTDFSLDAHIRDLEAVSADLEAFDLVARGHAVPIGITFAVRHPGRIKSLVCYGGWARASDFWATNERFESLIDVSWQVYTETIARNSLGWESGRASARAEYLRACTTPTNAKLIHDAMQFFDVTALLGQIQVPTLVVGRPESQSVHAADPRQLASRIHDAQLAMAGDWRAMDEAMERYLGIAGDDVDRSVTPAGSRGRPDSTSGTAIILFADIVDSTALQEQLGNAVFRNRSRTVEERVRAFISARGGTPVEGRTLGDGVLATFTSASDAIAAAVECATAGDELGLALHLGLHAGDVMQENGNVSGQAVSIASRVSDLSAPNEVLVSGTVRDIARASAGVSFEDRGEHELKGVSEPVRVFAVGLSISSRLGE